MDLHSWVDLKVVMGIVLTLSVMLLSHRSASDAIIMLFFKKRAEKSYIRI